MESERFRLISRQLSHSLKKLKVIITALSFYLAYSHLVSLNLEKFNSECIFKGDFSFCQLRHVVKYTVFQRA